MESIFVGLIYKVGFLLYLLIFLGLMNLMEVVIKSIEIVSFYWILNGLDIVFYDNFFWEV